MSEIKAAMLLMLFFVGILFPGILQFGIDAINQNAFTKNTKEYTELVQEEAGLTNKSKEVKERLESKGYQIKLTDQSGNTITGTVGYGNTIKIAYSYKYKSVFKHRTLKSSNVVLITKRDSTTAVRPTDPNNSSKTIRFITEESKDIVHLKSIDIPNLKTILQINSNTGNVFVQNISGNTVELKMDDGGFSRQVQIEGNYIKGEEKYVTNHTSAYYKDNEGYEGNLTKYLLGGHLIRGKQKYIGEHTTAYYKDKEGYEGDLAAYLYSGELKPGASKYVTGQTSSNYSDSQGYSGNLSRYVYSGSYTPESTKNVEDSRTSSTGDFPDQISYSQGGYSGTLYKKGSAQSVVISGSPAGSIFVDNVYGVGIRGYLTYKAGMDIWEDYEKNGYIGTLNVMSGTLGWDEKIVDGKTLYRAYAYYSGTLTKPDTRVYGYQQYYSGDVTKPATDTRVYRYQGTVNKPPVDTRVYRYQGIVKQPDIDTRSWGYQGIVSKNSIDTRTFEKYYQYEVEIVYEVKE